MSDCGDPWNIFNEDSEVNSEVISDPTTGSQTTTVTVDVEAYKTIGNGTTTTMSATLGNQELNFTSGSAVSLTFTPSTNTVNISSPVYVNPGVDGRLAYYDGNGSVVDDAIDLFYNDTDKKLGIQSITPSANLTVSGSSSDFLFLAESDSSNILSLYGDGRVHVTGTVSVLGNVNVTGTLTADRLTVSTVVSSSVIYESGSTKFGDTLDDTHQITGSLLVTGSSHHFTGSIYAGYISGSDGDFTTLQADYLDLNGLASDPAYNEGRLFYNSDEHLLSYWTDLSNVHLHLGQQLAIRVQNNTGGTVAKGTFVYFTGSTSTDTPRFRVADYSSEETADRTIGVTMTQTDDGDQTFALISGILTGVNTNSFNPGDIIYLSSSGGFTNVEPSWPNHAVKLGEVVRKQSVVGSILVNIDTGGELEDVHDVVLQSTSSGDLLVASNGYWQNTKQLTGSYGLTGSIDVTGNLTASGHVSASIFYGDGSNLTGISATPGGSDTHIQFNDGGSFGGSANLIWDDTNFKLTGSLIATGSNFHSITGPVVFSVPDNTASAFYVTSSTGDNNWKYIDIDTTTDSESITLRGHKGDRNYISISESGGDTIIARYLGYGGYIQDQLQNGSAKWQVRGSSTALSQELLYVNYAPPSSVVRSKIPPGSNARFEILNPSSENIIRVSGSGEIQITGSLLVNNSSSASSMSKLFFTSGSNGPELLIDASGSSGGNEAKIIFDDGNLQGTKSQIRANGGYLYLETEMGSGKVTRLGGTTGDGYLQVSTGLTQVTHQFKAGTLAARNHQFTGSVDVSTNITASGHVSASAFYGDGSNLTGISATPGGSDTHIQFNDGGSFGGSPNLTWDDTNFKLTGSLLVTGSSHEIIGQTVKLSGSTIQNISNVFKAGFPSGSTYGEDDDWFFSGSQDGSNNRISKLGSGLVYAEQTTGTSTVSALRDFNNYSFAKITGGGGVGTWTVTVAAGDYVHEWSNVNQSLLPGKAFRIKRAWSGYPDFARIETSSSQYHTLLEDTDYTTGSVYVVKGSGSTAGVTEYFKVNTNNKTVSLKSDTISLSGSTIQMTGSFKLNGSHRSTFGSNSDHVDSSQFAINRGNGGITVGSPGHGVTVRGIGVVMDIRNDTTGTAYFKVEGREDTNPSLYIDHTTDDNPVIKLSGSSIQMTGSVDVSTNITASGTVTATSFHGDGSSLTGISVTPGGSDNQLQFNDGGSFGGSANLTWDDTNLNITGSLSITGSSGGIIKSNLDSAGTGSLSLFTDGTASGSYLQLTRTSGSYMSSATTLSTGIGAGSSVPSASLSLSATTLGLATLTASYFTTIQGGNIRLNTTQTATGYSVLSDSLYVDGNTKISGSLQIAALEDNTESALYTTIKKTVSVDGTVLHTLSKSDYRAVFYDYSVVNGTNIRAGQIAATHDDTNVNYYESKTTDFGSTSDFELGVRINGSNIELTGSVASGTWEFKAVARGI